MRVDERFVRTRGQTVSDSHGNEENTRALQIPQITKFIVQYRRNMREHVGGVSSYTNPESY
jgi:hypothetical protein